MEMLFYTEVILPQVESGNIVNVELQKPYILQPKFTYKEKPIQPIKYVADFLIRYKDGSEVLFDVKGMADATAKLKRKLFWYNYPDMDYRWVTRVQKYGGWLAYEDVEKIRKENIKNKKMKDVS